MLPRALARRAVAGAARRGVHAVPRACAHDGELAQRTLVLLKPDAVVRLRTPRMTLFTAEEAALHRRRVGETAPRRVEPRRSTAHIHLTARFRLVGELLGRFERRGLAIVGLQQRSCARELAEAHYADIRDKPFFERTCVFLCSGPLVAVALEGRRAVAAARRLCGATEPLEAELGSIRGDLVAHWRRNLVHSSDSPEAAERELALWFRPEDLASAPTALEPWLCEVPTFKTTF
ncbi:nucleoside diphosphate kinase [Pelagophyceae sp. CCMP2097]|nr:nucleoside diphosphate kinase [Pelagophyceae sp. CCMP2097]